MRDSVWQDTPRNCRWGLPSWKLRPIENGQSRAVVTSEMLQLRMLSTQVDHADVSREMIDASRLM